MPSFYDAHFRHAIYFVKLLDEANQGYLQGDKARAESLDLFDAEWVNIRASNVWAISQNDSNHDITTLRICYQIAGENIIPLRLHSQEHGDWLGSTQARMPKSKFFQAYLRHAKHFGKVLQNAEELYVQGGEILAEALRLFDVAWENINFAQSWLAASMDEDEGVALLCTTFPDNGAFLLYLRLHPRNQIRWRQDALEAAQRMGWRMVEGIHLGNIGTAYHDIGELHKARRYNKKYLDIARETGDRHSESIALGNLGNDYRGMGDCKQAIRYYQQQLEITHELNDRRGKGNALGNLGLAFIQQGKMDKALENVEKAMQVFQDIGDRLGESRAHNNLGTIHYILADYHKSIECYRKAIAMDLEIGNMRGRATSFGELGDTYWALGNFEKAKECYQKELDISYKFGDQLSFGVAIGNLAGISRSSGNLDEAFEMYTQALSIFQKQGDRVNEAVTLAGLGTVNYFQGNPDQAREDQEQALLILNDVDAELQKADILNDLGKTLIAQTEIFQGIDRITKALEISRQIGDRRGEGYALWNLSLALDKLGERIKAIAHAETALKIFAQIEHHAAEKVRYQLALWEREE